MIFISSQACNCIIFMSVAGMVCMKADTCSSLIGSKIKGGGGRLYWGQNCWCYTEIHNSGTSCIGMFLLRLKS